VDPAEAARRLADELSGLRHDLAVLEGEAHKQKVYGFLQNRDAKTVKEMEFLGEAAALDLHGDILLLKARVRSMEDQLRIAFTWPDPDSSNT
jgi:hypothetical protein